MSDATRVDADLTASELWLRYFELGGMRTPVEVESFLRRGVVPSAHDHDVLAQALNERFSEFDGDHDHVPSQGCPSMGGPSPRSLAGGIPQLNLLGSFSLRVGAEPVRVPMNAQRLVTFLALREGLLLREHVAGSLWGDTTERRASGSLRSALWRLGRPAHPLVAVADAHIQLSPDITVDIRESVALARRILDDSRDLIEADLDATLLAAELLPDWSEDWVLVERESHNQLRLRALEALSRRLGEMGRSGHAVQVAMLAVTAEPLRESAQRTLVAAHLAEGNVSAAVAQFEVFRDLMRDELNMDPSPEMRTLVVGLDRRARNPDGAARYK